MNHLRRLAHGALALLLAPAMTALAGNQTATLSPVEMGQRLPFDIHIGDSLATADMPALHSFAKARHNGQWLIIGGLTAGQHSFTEGFFPEHHNTDLFVIDPVSLQVWSRSLFDPDAGLNPELIDTLAVTNSQFTQIGSQLYIAGGYGPVTVNAGMYKTFDTLTAVNIPGLMDWVKSAPGSAIDQIRQIHDPMFQVTGGEMLSTSNGRTHLVFGQDYPENYGLRLDGIYTHQVRSFTIIDDDSGLSVVDPMFGATQESFRRRDLNVVPILKNEGGQIVEKMMALSGVFTPEFGAWTVPVTIDSAGVAFEPDPLDPATFKQGMQHYRTATFGAYSAAADIMHILQFGGISFQYYDPPSGQFHTDVLLPFINDATSIVIHADGTMTQHLLPTGFPVIPQEDGSPFLLGTETEFFLLPGVPAYANGVIDLDALTGTTLVGYFYGGIAARLPNDGPTGASNALFPVYITVPEPASAALAAAGVLLWMARRRRGR